MMCYPVERDKTFIYPAAMFRTKERPTHGGVDFTPVKQGEKLPVFAVESGRIIISGSSKQAGNNIMILTESGRRWWYGHLARRDVNVGTHVKAGQQIGLMGTTGYSTGVHLHLELHFPYINAETNPWPLLADLPDINRKTIKPAASREKALIEYKEGGGFLMALSDAEQEELLKNTRDIAKAMRPPGAVYDWFPALNGKLDELLAESQSTNDALVKPVGGFRPIDIIRTHVVAIMKAVNEQANAQGVNLDMDAIASGVLDELGDAIVNRDK